MKNSLIVKIKKMKKEGCDTMKRVSIGRKLAALMMVICVAVPLLIGTVDADTVVPSSEEYTLSFSGVEEVFFGNAKKTNIKSGEEVYLTYTVDKVRTDHKAIQHGVLGTRRPETRYPYDKGGVLCYSDDAPIMEQGYTYFFKFSYNQDTGFEYVAARAKNGSSEWVWFDSRVGDETDNYSHYGIWLAGGIVSVRLTHVRCYDKNGNDLGIYAPKHRDTLLDEATVRKTNDELDHKYNISVNHATNVVISNAKQTSSDVVYMEYTVKESSNTKIYQWGLLNHHAPQKNYPHAGAGYLFYEMEEKNPGQGYLLQEGASYVITFLRRNGQVLTLVQRTLNGKVEFKEFVNTNGAYNPNDPYFALWLGEGANYPVNCEIVDFRCYDGNNNNLGVQTNDSKNLIKVEHFGELEDYAGCEAVYYDAQSGSTIMLYSDQTAKVTRDGVSETITYKIKDDVLTLNFADGVEEYTYFYQKFTAEDGSVYVRLGQYTVSFDTGTDEKIEPVTVNAQTGYMIAPPEDPEKSGAEFVGWYLSDGTEFDFGSIVDESITLYAKWTDTPDYQTLNGTKIKADTAWVIAITVSAVLLIAGTAVSIIVLKKGKKNEKTGK